MVATTMIYVKLLEEGSIAFRPTHAEKICEGVFRILPTEDYDLEDEVWEFPPGTIVRCEEEIKQGNAGGVSVLVAKEELLQYYTSRIMEDNSFFALTEAEDDILPKLEAQYQKESVPEHRAIIVRIIWEHRNKSSLTFLGDALSDPSDTVWQEALNGIVTIGGEEARELLRLALCVTEDCKEHWISEALNQIEQAET